MQDERKALAGRQHVEHDEQRHADRVREHRFAFGIGLTRGARLGDLRVAAAVLGLISVVLGRLALARSSRTG